MVRTESIHEDRDFRRIYRRGKTQVHPILVTYALKNKTDKLRIGLTASKKTGKACKRNRSKRVMREAYRKLETQLPGGWDFIFVARSRTAEVKMQDVLGVMKRQLAVLTSAKQPLPNGEKGGQKDAKASFGGE